MTTKERIEAWLFDGEDDAETADYRRANVIYVVYVVYVVYGAYET